MTLIVRTGPQEYHCQEGVLSTLTSRLNERQIERILIVHGQQSWQKAKPYLSNLIDGNQNVTLINFKGECSYEEVNRLVNIANELSVDAIVGVGGGKLIDTVKYAAEKISHVQSIIIPTLSSNCAPWTPLSVMYTPEGVALGFDIHHKQVTLLLVDPLLLLDSPVDYFIAGVADTLAKWYESDLILSRTENKSRALLQAARSQALICKENILSQGLAAVNAIQTGALNEAFTQIAETIIAISGLVGGLGDAYARTTIAHAVHDKITQFPQTHHFLHGEKVAYGIMLQLAFEEKWQELDQISVLFQQLQVPQSLAALNLSHLTAETIQQLAKEIAEESSLTPTSYEASADQIASAIHQLEAYLHAKEEAVYG